jgi:tetratricopeptide (TPR) repeat protein
MQLLNHITRSTSLAALLLCMALTACAAPTPDTAATQQAALLATQAAQPSSTPVPPTATPAPPTATSVPPTATPKPSDTPVPPTATRTPTQTPVPPTPTRTPTPTPAPPTATPTSASPATPTPPPPTPTLAVSPAEARVAQGFEYFDQEAWDKAIVEFEEAIRLDPQFAIAYLGLGYSYALGPGDLAKAIPALEKYLQLEPDAENRAGVEDDINAMRAQMASVGPCCPAAESGKGLLWVENFVGEPLLVDFGTNLGTQAYEVPAKQNDVSGCLCLSADAGHYILVVKTMTHEGRWELDIVPGQITHFPLRYAD